MTNLDDRVRELADAACSSHGAECVSIDIQRGRTGLVRVFVDADDGVDLDRCAKISSQLSRMLDADDPISWKYTLEVSTPGADRPLRAPREFRRNIGRPLRIALEAIKEPVEGMLVAVDEEAVTLKTDSGEIAVPLASVEDARVVFQW